MKSAGFSIPPGSALTTVKRADGEYFLRNDGGVLLSLKMSDATGRAAATTLIGNEWESKFYDGLHSRAPKAVNLLVETVEIRAITVEPVALHEVKPGTIVVTEEGTLLVAKPFDQGDALLGVNLHTGAFQEIAGLEVVTGFTSWVITGKRAGANVFELEGAVSNPPVNVKIGFA